VNVKTPRDDAKTPAVNKKLPFLIAKYTMNMMLPKSA
jgi:hypothetical protein